MKVVINTMHSNTRAKSPKQVIWSLGQALAQPDAAMFIADFYHLDVDFNACQPINQLCGAGAVVGEFWRPLLTSFPNLTQRPDILIAGTFNGSDWVASTGYMTGTFARNWLTIPASGRETRLHYGAFDRVLDGRIAESYLIIDLPDVMRQAGLPVLPPDQADGGFPPPPYSQDGVFFEAPDPAESAKSLALVESMIFDGLLKYDGVNLDSMHQENYWHPQFEWYGPCGIGTTRGLRDFQQRYQQHFLRAFPDRVGGNHKARFAEGSYVASTGWPSIRATFSAEWLGCPPTYAPITMRVMDWWRRDGDGLLWNWVFIDIIDLFLQAGVDLFERMRARTA